jgi:hypothetical protein
VIIDRSLRQQRIRIKIEFANQENDKNLIKKFLNWQIPLVTGSSQK